MKIGSLELGSRALLAPLAGITDIAFRTVCREFGAGCCETEMVSAKALSFGDKKSLELMTLGEGEHPCGIQIFGTEPDIMANAAKLAEKMGAAYVDINMGCPAPKVFNNGCGCALMDKPALCGEIVYAVKNAADIPVTVKIRKGIDDGRVNAVEVAVICAENGADAITVHGRTRAQYYSGQCDLNIIKEVKKAVTVPVIGNGDVRDIKSAERMYRETGCDGIMIARAALGAPWIFEIINAYFEKGIITEPPSYPERLEIMRKHVELCCKLKGEHLGVLQSRKLMAWYFKGFPGAAQLRNEACRVSSLDEMYGMIESIRNS